MSVNATDGHCLNCGTALHGQYCGQCGQRASGRLISLWELIRDAFGDLFELDSRLWRTLVPMLAKPGKLTREYLEGRRARYMPPFRSYLVLSLLFFLVAFFDPHNEFAIFFEDDAQAAGTSAPELSEEQVDDIRAARERGGEEARRVIDELVRSGVIDRSVLESADLEAPATPDEPATDADESARPETPDVAGNPEELKISFANENEGINCSTREYDLSSAPAWVQRRLSEERLNRLCDRWEVEGGEGLGQAMIDRIPAALILLLPVMALVLKILYPLSRRYYVEHLLFFVHFHSFFFLILTLMILWQRLTAWVGLPEAVGVLPVVAASFYIPVYLFIAMRRVYGQGRFLTFLKYLVLVVAYAVGFSFMMLGALVMAATSDL